MVATLVESCPPVRLSNKDPASMQAVPACGISYNKGRGIVCSSNRSRCTGSRGVRPALQMYPDLVLHHAQL